MNPFIEILGRYRTAVLEKNVFAFVALYDDDICVFDAWDKWTLRGLHPWRNVVSEWFSSLGTDHVVVSFQEAQCEVSGNLAIGHATLTYTAKSQACAILRSISNRVTMALKETGDMWRIFHEHTSLPIDHRSMRAVVVCPDEQIYSA